jgi:transcriptional regulator with XRE-family HTH domain
MCKPGGATEIPLAFYSCFMQGLKQNKVSQREIARQSGISESYLSRTLKGVRGIPSDDVLLKMGEALQIHPPERLIIAANRIPDNDWNLIELLFKVLDLTDEEYDKLLRYADSLTDKYSKEKLTERKATLSFE